MITHRVAPSTKRRTHHWEHYPRRKRETVSLPWAVCIRCGLLAIRNEASEKAAKAPCAGHEEND